MLKNMVKRKYVKKDVIMQIDKNLIKLKCLETKNQWVEEKGLEKMVKVIDR
jgi:hypothetical protein